MFLRIHSFVPAVPFAVVLATMLHAQPVHAQPDEDAPSDEVADESADALADDSDTPGDDASANADGGVYTEPSEGAATSGAGEGFLKRRGYVHLAPGAMALILSSPTAVLYSWGVSGGYHLPVSDKFILEVGGFFDHVVRGGAHYFGIGPELRLGGGSSKIFGYGLFRVALGINHLNLGFLRATGTHFLATFGGGIQGLVHKHVAIGGEPAFDLLAIGGGASGLFRLRLFVSILF